MAEASFTSSRRILGRHFIRLDTVTDVVKYLVAKEDFLTKGTVVFAGTEANLLAFYISNGVPSPKDQIY